MLEGQRLEAVFLINMLRTRVQIRLSGQWTLKMANPYSGTSYDSSALNVLKLGTN